MVIGAANQIRLDDGLAEFVNAESPDWNEYGSRRSHRSIMERNSYDNDQQCPEREIFHSIYMFLHLYILNIILI